MSLIMRWHGWLNCQQGNRPADCLMIGEEQSSLDNLNIFKAIFHFRGEIQNIMLNTEHLKLRQVPNESVKALERVCFEAGGLSGELEGGLYNIPFNKLQFQHFFRYRTWIHLPGNQILWTRWDQSPFYFIEFRFKHIAKPFWSCIRYLELANLYLHCNFHNPASKVNTLFKSNQRKILFINGKLVSM